MGEETVCNSPFRGGKPFVDMDDEGFIAIENVLLVSDGAVLTIEVDGCRYSLPLYEASWEESVRQAGERGTLLMRREFAERVGLVKATEFS